MSEDLLLLLCAGVGVYVDSEAVDKKYSRLVLEYAEAGKLAYIVSDSSIAYGTNYPINRVFVTKDFSDTHSLNTVYQLISRAGRVGKSWLAEAFIDEECAKRIISMTRVMSDNDNIEVKHLNELYEDIKSCNDERDKQLLEELARTNTIAQEKKRKEEERKKAEEEAKRRAEEQAKRLAEEQERAKREQIEEEKRRLDEIRLKRQNMSRGPTVSLTSVVNSQPARNVAIATDFQRQTRPNAPTTNDRFARLQKLKK
jgi:hypothetical protein